MQLHEFLHQVKDRAHLTDIDDALRASQATLRTLSERLAGREPLHLGAQLPGELAGFLKPPAGTLPHRYSLQDFFRRISEIEGVEPEEAADHARVVLGVLSDAVSPGEIDDVLQQLPKEYRILFQRSGAGGRPS